MSKAINLSPSKLNLFNECPRCFWDAYAAKCPRPRGIFPSLPGGMDRVFKDYADRFRGTLPPMLDERVRGVLMGDIAKLNQWRNWRTGLTYIDAERQIKLIGALDDCLIDGDIYIPLDWKTKGSQPKDDGSQYYQTQLDCYNLMLSASGYRVADEGYLVYIYPELCESSIKTAVQISVDFGVNIYRINCNTGRAKELVVWAAECLRGNRPDSSVDCEHCAYLRSEDGLTRRILAE